MGVGFSNKDDNSILSADWTFGAINMLRCLKEYYATKDDLKRFRPHIEADISAMWKGVQSLRRLDRYGSSDHHIGRTSGEVVELC